MGENAQPARREREDAGTSAAVLTERAEAENALALVDKEAAREELLARIADPERDLVDVPSSRSYQFARRLSKTVQTRR